MGTENIYTNNVSANSADTTTDFFNNFNRQQINLKTSDVAAFVNILKSKGMGEETAKETTNIILTQCNIDELDPMVVYEEIRQTPNMELTDLLGEILNINRPKSSTLGTARVSVWNSAKRNIIDSGE